jgi:hypothetical protein
MRTNNIAALEYNIDENWGFYVDIENLKPISLNNNINIEPNDDDYYNKRYGSESYNSEIFCMDEDIEPNKNIDKYKNFDKYKNNINTVNDIIMNVRSATLITAALSCIILFML